MKKKLKEIFPFDMASSVVMMLFGIVIVVADIFAYPPATISTVVLGGLLTITGVIGFVLNMVDSKP